MAGSTIPTLGAGSKFYYEPSASPGTWVLLANALNVGEVGSTGEFIETTPIAKEVREYINGMKTPPDKTITFNDTPGDSAYQAYLAEVDAGNTVNHRVDYKNNHRAEFAVVLNGRIMQEPEGNTQLKMNVLGKQSGDTTWSVI
ncbi:MAG: phage tail tube protein [Porticoccus sp.]|uniref:phage tail tube protein n=1 Tax=Porticoccus sp. TaxID=2024853 RepID=UPI0032977422